MIKTVLAAVAASFVAVSAASADGSFSPTPAPQTTAPVAAQPQTAAVPPEQKADGIDSLFTKKFDGGDGKRDCHDISVGVADDKYVSIAVLLPAEGNEPPPEEAGKRVTYTFEAVIDPTTARMSPTNSVLGVQQCTFGTNGQSVWFKVNTARVMNSNVPFLGTTIPLTPDQVVAQPAIQVSLKSGTYKGRWVKAGDNEIVVLAKQ